MSYPTDQTKITGTVRNRSNKKVIYVERTFLAAETSDMIAFWQQLHQDYTDVNLEKEKVLLHVS